MQFVSRCIGIVRNIMNNLDIAAQRELNDQKLITEYEGGATNEWEYSSAIRFPGAWSFFYLGDRFNNCEQETKTDRAVEA